MPVQIIWVPFCLGDVNNCSLLIRKTHTGAIFSLVTLAIYSLSYTQFPRRLPKLRSARFRPSVVPSFFAFSKAAALPLQFSICPYPTSCYQFLISLRKSQCRSFLYLVICPITEYHSNDDRQAEAYFTSALIFIDLVDNQTSNRVTFSFIASHEIDLNSLYTARPAIESEDFVGEVYTLIRR